MGGGAGRKTAHEDGHVLIPRTRDRATFHGTVDFADSVTIEGLAMGQLSWLWPERNVSTGEGQRKGASLPLKMEEGTKVRNVGSLQKLEPKDRPSLGCQE